MGVVGVFRIIGVTCVMLAGLTVLLTTAGSTAAAIPAVASVALSPAGLLRSVPATRLLDTRPNAVAASGTITVPVAGHAGIPTDIAAVQINLTATSPTAPGYLNAYPNNTPRPATSIVNFTTHQTIANSATIAVGTDGKIAVYNGSPGTTAIIVDITGYYLAGNPTAPGALHTIPAARLLDTRPGHNSPTGTITVPVAGHAGIPTDIAAVQINLTATSPTAPGYLNAYPNNTPRPATSIVNFTTHQTIANSATIAVGTDGKIAVYNGSPGTTAIIVDITGYYLAGNPTAPGALHTIPAARLLDTRPGHNSPTGTITVPVAGHAGIPTDIGRPGVSWIG